MLGRHSGIGTVAAGGAVDALSTRDPVGAPAPSSGTGTILAEGGTTGHLGAFALTSPLVSWGALVIVAAVFAVGIWVVPRWIHDHHLSVLRARLVQGLTLVLCSVLAMVTTGIWLNRSFVFYGSWEDLLDMGGQQVTTSQYGGAAGTGTVGGAIGHDSDPDGTAVPRTPVEVAALAAARTAPVDDLQKDPLHDPALTGVEDSRAGQYVEVEIPGRASDVSAPALVHLPAGYLEHPERRYPVLLAFSGIPGTPSTWREAFALGTRMDQLAHRHLIEPAIIVMPAVYPGTHDTECVDPTSGHERYETWITQDVADWTRTHLRTIEDPFAWATVGYSAGGWCASMLSVRHPDLARASISLGGYFVVDYAQGQEWTRPDDPDYDLPQVVAREKPPVVMYFFSGGEDPLSQPSLGQMEKAVQAPTSLTVRRTVHGGHLVTLWQAQISASLTWLGGHSAGFSPIASGRST